MSALGSIFGGSSAPQINYTPQGFTSGGLTGTYTGGSGFNVSESPGLQSQVGSLQSTFQNASNATGQLAQTVQPGFSQLRQAGLAQIASTQQGTLSNLQDNLAQRRVLGSSFAQNSLSQSQADFAQQSANFSAQSYLQELNASNQLLQQQFNYSTQAYTTGINQMNLEAGLAAQLTGQANSALSNVATAQGQLDMQNAQLNSQNIAGIGKGIGSLLTAPGSSIFGQGVSSLFGSGANGSIASSLGLGSGISDADLIASLALV